MSTAKMIKAYVQNSEAAMCAGSSNFDGRNLH